MHWVQKYQNRLYIKTKYSAVNKDVDNGATIFGDEERTRYNLSAKYKANEWVSLKGKLEKRSKEYKELNSTVDYTSASGGFSIKKDKLGKVAFNLSYYLGEFENQSNSVNYEFSDYVLSAYIYPELNSNFSFWTGATYYRSHRDIDLEKFNFNLGVTWEFIETHYLEAKYRAYTYDDLMIISNNYTANIIEISLIKDIKL